MIHLKPKVSLEEGLFVLFVKRYKRLNNEKKEDRKLFLFETLDFLVSLIDLHMKAIGKVAEPILKYKDVERTHENLWDLVYNSDFPTGYSTIRGTLKGFRERHEFKKKDNLNCLDAVRRKLYHFQVAAFLLTEDMDEATYPSYHVYASFKKAVDLWRLLSVGKVKKSQFEEVSKIKLDMLSSAIIYPWAKPNQSTDFKTADDVVSYIFESTHIYPSLNFNLFWYIQVG